MKDSGYFLRFVIQTQVSVCLQWSEPSLVIEMHSPCRGTEGRGTPLRMEMHALLFRQKGGHSVPPTSAVSQLHSAKKYLTPKWHILGWCILIPFVSWIFFWHSFYRLTY